MPKIGFGMIDAKDSEVIDIDGDRAMNEHNAVIMGQAEAEYLNALLGLQRRIKERYEPQLIENKPPEGMDRWEAMSECDEIAYKEENKTLDPEADKLWYS